MNTAGKGEKEPIADNGTAEGRTENRRIEFYVQQ
jgi:flagellar motor protein MotB